MDDDEYLRNAIFRIRQARADIDECLSKPMAIQVDYGKVIQELREVFATLKDSNDEWHKREVEKCILLTAGKVPIDDWTRVCIEAEKNHD